MLTLPQLIAELREVASSHDERKLARIEELLTVTHAPAEHQVGRHVVARELLPEIERGLASLDPRDRKRAVLAIHTTFPRSLSGRLLRRVVKDPDPAVRSAARRAVRQLGLDDVAPPDIRYQVTDGSPLGRGNPTGWAFGIFPTDHSPTRRPKPTSRPSELAKLALPELANPAAVAALVGVAHDDLTALMRPGCDPGSGYVEFEIPKAKGGTRRIAAPRARLRVVQRIILDQILAKVPLHDACHGFVAGRSTVTNASPHRGSAIVIKLDLQDFFPTVHYRRVRGLFAWLGYSAEVSATLAGLTTYRPKLADGEVAWPGVLPQGAPTSPALANLACRRLDQRLAQLAAKFSATYTRYADDMTFSFARQPEVRLGRFLWWVDGICQQEGFTERADKRRILRANSQQRITGLVVNHTVNVPRHERRRFRAILHNCARHGIASQAGDHPDFAAYLAGYAAYLNMVDPVFGKQCLAEVARLIAVEQATHSGPNG